MRPFTTNEKVSPALRPVATDAAPLRSSGSNAMETFTAVPAPTERIVPLTSAPPGTAVTDAFSTTGVGAATETKRTTAMPLPPRWPQRLTDEPPPAPPPPPPPVPSTPSSSP